MITVIQRVSRAVVRVEESGFESSLSAGAGLLVLLGIEDGDTETNADWLAGKIARLRIFRDENGLMNRSVTDVSGGIMVVSQFTLAGDAQKGNRPSFATAARPELAEPIYEYFVSRLRTVERIAEVETGVFGAMMAVELINDGPVTLILRHP